jgi:hypothetical protein
VAPAAPVPVHLPAAGDHVVAALLRASTDSGAERDSSLLPVNDAVRLPGFARRIDHPPQA